MAGTAPPPLERPPPPPPLPAAEPRWADEFPPASTPEPCRDRGLRGQPPPSARARRSLARARPPRPASPRAGRTSEKRTGGPGPGGVPPPTTSPTPPACYPKGCPRSRRRAPTRPAPPPRRTSRRVPPKPTAAAAGARSCRSAGLPAGRRPLPTDPWRQGPSILSSPSPPGTGLRSSSRQARRRVPFSWPRPAPRRLDSERHRPRAVAHHPLEVLVPKDVRSSVRTGGSSQHLLGVQDHQPATSDRLPAVFEGGPVVRRYRPPNDLEEKDLRKAASWDVRQAGQEDGSRVRLEEANDG